MHPYQPTNPATQPCIQTYQFTQTHSSNPSIHPCQPTNPATQLSIQTYQFTQTQPTHIIHLSFHANPQILPPNYPFKLLDLLKPNPLIQSSYPSNPQISPPTKLSTHAFIHLIQPNPSIPPPTYPFIHLFTLLSPS